MYKKILTGFILILITGISLTGFLSMEVAKNTYVGYMEKTLRKDCYLVKEYAFDQDIDLKNINVKKILPIIKMTNNRITIIDIDGKVIYDSHEKIKNMDNHKHRSEVQEALHQKESSVVRYSKTLKKDMMYYAIPLKEKDRVQGVLRISIPLDEANFINKNMFISLVVSSLIGIIIASIIAYRYLYYTTKPIKELTAAVKDIAGGNFSRRITILPKDEFGELGISFNEMAKQLQLSMETLKIQNIKLETILNSMPEGIIAVDTQKNIMLINPSAREIFHIKEKEQIIGKNILENIRNHQFYKVMNDILINQEREPIEIKIDASETKILRISSAPIRYISKYERIRGIILIIEDITQLRKLENVRRDFIANVSHELKTPITSIRGFVETLRSGEVQDENMQKRFLEIIDLESERLIRLVEDILTLSDLENNLELIQMEKIDVKETLNEIIAIMRQLASKKEITIRSNIEENMNLLYFTKDKFKQMMINLIDNAIKYTPKGGKVEVNAYQNKNQLQIEIKDTGIGIPKEDIPRLFERFYRVDKARSRSAGGTGLGLAIVKHILQLMNGKIKVESELGKGTSFILFIPITTN